MIGSLVWQDVTAGYGRTVAIENISISVKRGERVGIVGRNGAGKTTTLAAMLGKATVRSGDVLADGVSLRAKPTYLRSRMGIGIVPQTRDVFPSLRVRENLLAGLKDNQTDLLEEAYALFPRLKERERNLGSELSGGEQQMLSIARSLMGKPEILLLDEPLEGLAPIIVSEVMQAIEVLVAEGGLGCVLVEQHVNSVLRFCERVLVLVRGKQVFYGSSEELRFRPEILERAVGLDRSAALAG